MLYTSNANYTFVTIDTTTVGIRNWLNIDGLAQGRRNSIANALELRLPCTNPSIWGTYGCGYVVYHVITWHIDESSMIKLPYYASVAIGLLFQFQEAPITGEFPAQRPVTRSFDVFFDVHRNKRLSRQ